MAAINDAEFVSLLVKNQRRIYGYILTVVPDCNEADDLYQQTSMVLWEKRGQFDAGGDFVRWGCGIAHNLIRNWCVKRRRDRHCFSAELMAQIAAVRAEKSEWLETALTALSGCMDDLDEFDRRLLNLCYEGQRTIRRVSEELGRTENAVYQRLHRARARLLDCIQNKLREKQSP